jgi:hypothetical protein
LLFYIIFVLILCSLIASVRSIDEGKAIYYPNIEYYNQFAVFYFYKCNEYTKSIIMNTANGLYDWRH